jgi:RND family efflux transporter MFP subunit
LRKASIYIVVIYTPWGIVVYFDQYIYRRYSMTVRIPASVRRPLLLGLATFIALSPLSAVADAARPVPVATLVLQPKVAGASYDIDGVVQAVRQSTVAAQANGRLVTMAVKAGDRVRAGQVLATIDDRDAMAGVQRSRAQVSQAQAELQNAQAQLERTRDLQSKGFVSTAALDVAKSQAQSAQSAKEQANAAALQSGLAQGFTKVTAPFDGWVLQTHAEAGDLALPGKPIATVYAPQPLRVVVQVPSSRAQVVRAADQTIVQVGDDESVTTRFTPKTRTAVPSADPVSQTTEWRLELSTQDAANLLPGQQAHVRFIQNQGAVAPRLWVPKAAVVRRGELTGVYLWSGNGFSLRAIRAGAIAGADGVEVLTGLRASDQIALDPVRAAQSHAVPATSAK